MVAIAAGERITAARLGRLQPTTYYAQIVGTLGGGFTGADIPGLSIPFTTTAANAIYVAQLVCDFDWTGAGTGTSSARLALDGSGVGLFIVAGAEVATDRMTLAQNYRGTIPTAGAHTIKATATTQTYTTINQYSTLALQIYEVA